MPHLSLSLPPSLFISLSPLPPHPLSFYVSVSKIREAEARLLPGGKGLWVHFELFSVNLPWTSFLGGGTGLSQSRSPGP